MSEVMLGAGGLNARQQECAEAILFSGGIMLSLVNNILDFSRLEAHKLVLERIPFSIRSCIERAAQTIEVKAEEKGIELIVSISADVPETNVGDPSRLCQVLLNLLSNAVKFTHRGYVQLTCGYAAETSTTFFSVHDTGIETLIRAQHMHDTMHAIPRLNIADY